MQFEQCTRAHMMVKFATVPTERKAGREGQETHTHRAEQLPMSRVCLCSLGVWGVWAMAINHGFYDTPTRHRPTRRRIVNVDVDQQRLCFIDDHVRATPDIDDD